MALPNQRLKIHGLRVICVFCNSALPVSETQDQKEPSLCSTAASPQSFPCCLPSQLTFQAFWCACAEVTGTSQPRECRQRPLLPRTEHFTEKKNNWSYHQSLLDQSLYWEGPLGGNEDTYRSQGFQVPICIWFVLLFQEFNSAGTRTLRGPVCEEIPLFMGYV